MARKARLVVVNEINRGRVFQSLYRLAAPPVVAPTGLPRDWQFPQPASNVRARLAGTEDSSYLKVILHVGGYSAVRCTDMLIRSLCHLDDRYLLVFTSSSAGSDSAKMVIKAAAAAGVRPRIRLLPHLSFEVLLGLIAVADIGCLLYPNDGIGNFFQGPGRLTEYVGSGTPFVASDFPGLRYVTERHGLGATAIPTDAESIAHAIREVCESGESRDERSRRLHRAFEERLCFDVCAGDYLGAWDRLLPGRARGVS